VLDVITIAGSPSASSRSTAVLEHARATLEQRGLRTRALSVRDLPAEDLIYGRVDSPAILQAGGLLRQARGLVIATPIYKAAYSGVLKAFLDLLPQTALAGKLVLPIATGGSPGHLLAIDYALRPVLAALGAQHVLQGVFITDSQIGQADGRVQLDPEVGVRLDGAVRAFADLLAPFAAPANGLGKRAAGALTAAAEDVRGPDAEQLITELSAELAALYETSDGSAGFKPEDVEVPRAAFIVARIDGFPVGCGALRPLDATTVEVKRMYTRAEYRRRGVAQAILAEMERLALEFGYTTLKLQTGPKQPEAAALYERVGYYPIPRFSGNWDRVLAYQKDLIAVDAENELDVAA
jgi:SsuE family FMN reductase